MALRLALCQKPLDNLANVGRASGIADTSHSLVVCLQLFFALRRLAFVC